MKRNKYIVVFITARDFKEAEKIASFLVNKHIAACVNIIDGIKSYFFWKGKVQIEKEALLIVKTKQTAFDKLKKAVKGLHSYTVPEIIGMKILKGNKEYLDWIRESVK